MYREFQVKKDERALLFRKGEFDCILAPGVHRFIDPLYRLSVEVFSLDKPLFDHRLVNYLVKAEPGLVAEHFHVVALGQTEIGLRYENGVLVELAAPNARRLYWKGYIDIRVQVVDIADRFNVEKSLIAALVRGPVTVIGAAQGVLPVQVPEYHVGVLYVDGKIEGLLEPGLYAFYRFNRDLRTELVDLRMQ